MAAPKPEDITHPPMEQLPGLEYCIDSNPPWPETIILGFQHYILMLGTTVMVPTFLVPAMGGNDHDKVRVIQTLLFVAGINTLLQSLFGTRLPTVVGGSFAFIIPITSIINDSSLRSIPDDHERFSYHASYPRSIDCFVKLADHPWLQPTLGYRFSVFQSTWYDTSYSFGWIWII